MAVYGSRHRQGIEQIWAVYSYGAIRAVFYRILRPYTAVNTVTTISYTYISDSIYMPSTSLEMLQNADL